jgi:glycosyltransferase 2 family protein
MSENSSVPPRAPDQNSARPVRSGALRIVLTALLTLAVIVLLIRELAGTREFLDAVADANPALVTLAFAFACASVVVSTLRWQQVLAAMGHPLRFGRALQTVLAAWPVSVVTPSRAGDFARPFLVRELVPVFAGAGSVLAEKAIDIHTLLWVTLIASLAHGLWLQSVLVLLMIALEWAVVIAIMRGRGQFSKLQFFRARADKIEQLYRAFDALAGRPIAVVAISISSLAVRLLTVAIVVALLAAVGTPVNFFSAVAPWLIATLAGLVPVTFGGMGTRDAAFVVLLESGGHSGPPQAAVLAATMGYSLLAIWSFALIGLPILSRSSLRLSPER